jgi:hypothetical protein
MTSISTNLHEYKAAVALNNMGVTLLQRRCLKDAMDTLKDAITIMKSCFRPQGNNYQAECLDIDLKMQRASKRMAISCQNPSSICMDIFYRDGCDIQPSMIRSLINKGVVSSIPPASVKIDSIDFEGLEDRDLDLESALMLYNFGIAHYCMSQIARSPASANMLRTGALKLYSMAKTVLSNPIYCPSLLESQLEDFYQSRARVASLVLSATAHIQVEMGLHVEANETYKAMVHLASSVLDEYDCDDDEDICNQASVAAAA